MKSSQIFVLFLTLSFLKAAWGSLPQPGTDQIPDALIIIKAKSGQEYGFQIQPDTPSAQYMADYLSTEDYQKFQEKRKLFLNRAAAVLNYSGLTFGIGSVVKDQFKQLLFFWKKTNPVDAAAAELPAPLTLKQRSHIVITNILHAIDNQLWTDAPLVIRSQELGVKLNIAAITMHGVQSKGFGGSAGLTLSIAYNYQQQSLIFEIPMTFEKFQSAYPTTLLMGLNFKAGFFINDGQDRSYKTQSTSFYPPILPTFLETSRNELVGGFSTLLGLPPSPFSDMMSWKTKITQYHLFRVAISPIFKGFVRVSSAAVEPIAEFMKRFNERLNAGIFPKRGPAQLKCQAIFSL